MPHVGQLTPQLARRRRRRCVAATVGCALTLFVSGRAPAAAQNAFDHGYARYGELLAGALVSPHVDYGRLAGDRAMLDTVVAEFGQVSADEFGRWSRMEQLAYWVNAYNLFTLRVIVDHYPIQGSWFSLYPRNSIRQIDGVWEEITWRAAGRTVTLDEIEHGILRPTFAEPLIHFALNCAALSCPPLRAEPYLPDTVAAQFADATREALAQEGWLQLDGDTLRLTAILDWFGEDFVPRFAGRSDVDRSDRDRALLGLVAEYGPTSAAALARKGTPRIRFLTYDWTLNDVSSPR